MTAEEMNAKYSLWYSHCTNPAGNILYNHVQSCDYSILDPEISFYHSPILENRLDVLDIVIIKLPIQTVEIINLNDLSSNYNPIFLTISDSPGLSHLKLVAELFGRNLQLP